MKTNLIFQALGQSLYSKVNTPVLAILFLVSSSAFGQTYCVPTSLCGNSNSNFAINTLTIKNNDGSRLQDITGGGSVCDATSQGYSDFSADVINISNLQWGNTYRIAATATANMGYAAWIDYNKDQDFDDAGELLFSLTTYSPGFSNIGFTLPAGISGGYYRLRIRSASTGTTPITLSANQSCGNLAFGETEDHTLSIDNYCIPQGNNFCSNVHFASIVAGGSNVFGPCMFRRDGYTRYESISFYPTAPSVIAGSVLPIFSDIGNNFGPSQTPINFGIWIDFNNNKNFDDPGEFVSSGIGNSYIGGNIQIPNNSNFIGERRVRMRIGTSNPFDATSSCLPMIYPYSGETVDFTIKIQKSSGVLTSGDQYLCPPADPSPISFSDLPTGLVTYNWYYLDGLAAQPTGTPSAPWVFIPTANPNTGATFPTYDPPAGLNANRTYACYVTSKLFGVPPLGWATGVRQVRVSSKYCGFTPKRMALEEEKNAEVKVGLEQNIPNPFSSETVISCFVPETSEAARLQIFSMDGRNVLDMELTEKGKLDIPISRKQLPGAGIYQYRLIHSGKMEPAKRLVVAD
jgi:GEVED domain